MIAVPWCCGMNAIRLFGQLRLVRDVDPVGRVLLEHLGRHLGIELVVDVLAAGLVLDERERVRELADVVVVGRHAGQQRIGSDRLGRALRQIADHQRVVVRARRLDEQPPEQRLGRVRQLEQLEHRQDPEHAAEHGERADGRDRRTRRRQQRRGHQLDHAAGIVQPEESERGDDEDVDDRHREPGLDEDLESIAAADAARCRPCRRGRCTPTARATRSARSRRLRAGRASP